jgi:molybdopterin-guanine dinucleotide biosynthesis protein
MPNRADSYFHLHLVSDATGETLTTVARAATAQYTKMMPVEHVYPLVRTQKQLDRVLAEIEEAPHDCLVREVVRRWFDGKVCTLCGRPIAPVRWHGHKPAFKAADDRIWECHEIPAEQLPVFMARARAVCWSCMIVEGFRHDHPDLVVERPRPPRPATHH